MVLKTGLILPAPLVPWFRSLLAVFAVGAFFIGPSGVVLPLMIRDVYGGGVDQLAFALALFPFGTISGSLLVRRYGLRRKGRAMLMALLTAAFLQACLGSGLPFWGFTIGIFGWCLGGTFFIEASSMGLSSCSG